jgi:chromosome partitioning protein
MKSGTKFGTTLLLYLSLLTSIRIHMAKIIAISNQKGGVGKTTSSISIVAELALMGRKCLLVDFDPQGNATSGLGVSLPEEGNDLYDVFLGRIGLKSIIKPTSIENLDIAPSSRDLIGLEVELGKTPGRELILRSQLRLINSTYEYIIIDCPPSLGILTLNALGAAESVLIPLQSEYYALEGVSALMNTYQFVKQTFNTSIDILGVFLTMFDSRTNLSQQVENEARNFFGPLMFKTVIPRSVKLSEAPSHGMPICLYDSTSSGARAYRRLAWEVDRRCYGAEEDAKEVKARDAQAKMAQDNETEDKVVVNS